MTIYAFADWGEVRHNEKKPDLLSQGIRLLSLCDGRLSGGPANPAIQPGWWQFPGVSYFRAAQPGKLGVQRSHGFGSALPQRGAQRDRCRWRGHQGAAGSLVAPAGAGRRRTFPLAEAVQLRNSGLSIRCVAAKIRFPVSTVQAALRAHSLVEAQKLAVKLGRANRTLKRAEGTTDE